MNSAKLSFNNNPNIGLYIFVNDNILLIGDEVSEKDQKELERVFDLKASRTSIAGTPLLGVFIAGNNDTLVIPDIAFENEIEQLKQLDLSVEVIKTKQTCLGNNIIVAKNQVILTKEFTEQELRQIEKAFKMPASQMQLKSTNSLGSITVINPYKNKAMVGNDITDEEFDLIEKEIGYELEAGSVNMGSPYVKSGLAVNKNGYVIGKTSGGPEINNAEEALGFLE